MQGISSDDANAGRDTFDAADATHRVEVRMDCGSGRIHSPAIERLKGLSEAAISAQGAQFRVGGEDGAAESAASKARRQYFERTPAFEASCEEFDKVAVDELLSIANARIGIARQSLSNANDPDIRILEAFVWYIENARANNIDAGDLEIVPLKEALTRLRCVLQEWTTVKKPRSVRQVGRGTSPARCFFSRFIIFTGSRRAPNSRRSNHNRSIPRKSIACWRQPTH